MLYLLSKIIPVHMHTTYRIKGARFTSSWWQWRGNIYNHTKTAV